MPDSLEDVLARYDDAAPLERAWTIPGAWYTDPRVEALERRTVWSRTWQVVGRAAQVAEPGQFVTAEVGGEPVVVVRGADGVLRGFFNVCRHHAAAVMTAPCGRADRLRCPYHGWTYDLAGRLRGVPEFDGVRDFDRDANGLVPVSVATWESFVLRPPRSGSDAARGVPRPRWSSRSRRSGSVRCTSSSGASTCSAATGRCSSTTTSTAATTCRTCTRGSDRSSTTRDYSIETFERVCLQSSPIDAAGGEAATAAVREGTRALYYWVYPNFMLNWYAGYLDTNLVIPLGVDRTKVVFDFYFDDLGEARAEKNRQSIAISERIQDEDHAICESVQRGVASRAYGAGRLSVRREAGEHLFHRLLARDLRAG